MTDGQARVLVLLGVLIGIEILFSTTARQAFQSIGATLASWLAPVSASKAPASGGGGSAGGF